jgi:hypothetical protein
VSGAGPGQAALPPLPPKWTGKFRKRPVEIQAVQLVDDLRNHTEIATWIESNGGHAEVPFAEPCLYIETLEGRMRADIGDYVIKGVKGEFYPCKPDIFTETYEPEDSVRQSAPVHLLTLRQGFLCNEPSGAPGDRGTTVLADVTCQGCLNGGLRGLVGDMLGVMPPGPAAAGFAAAAGELGVKVTAGNPPAGDSAAYVPDDAGEMAR